MAVVVAGLAARPANAISSSIMQLYNTGNSVVWNSTSAQLSAGLLQQSPSQTATSDASHWVLAAVPSAYTNPSGTPFATQLSTLPGAYADHSLSSDQSLGAEWITPNKTGGSTVPSGNYIYQQSFTLTGGTPTGSSIGVADLNFSFLADQYISSIVLNGTVANDAVTGGTAIYTASSSPSPQYSALTTVNYSSTAGYKISSSGATNTLTFVVKAPYSRGGLFVKFNNATYQPVPAPPAAISLGIGSLVGMIGTSSRRLRSRLRLRKK
jgi:hypothetical protein